MIAALLLTIFTFTAPFHPVLMVNGKPDPFGRPDTSQYLHNPMTVEFHYVERRFHPDPSSINAVTMRPFWLEEGRDLIKQTFTGVMPGQRVTWDDGGLLMFGTGYVVPIYSNGVRCPARSNYVPSRLAY
jgi:hypothetical protein